MTVHRACHQLSHSSRAAHLLRQVIAEMETKNERLEQEMIARDAEKQKHVDALEVTAHRWLPTL